MRVVFLPEAILEYMKLQDNDRNASRKVNQLIADMMRHPFEGLGKPEPLKYMHYNCWSRRINQRDRLVYQVEEGDMIIVECGGHYDG